MKIVGVIIIFVVTIMCSFGAIQGWPVSNPELLNLNVNFNKNY
jgi:hypothetical protein